MTRDEKINAFFTENDDCLRWCEGGACACACMGCINGSLRYVWKEAHPDEDLITRAEYERLRPAPRPPGPPISFSFRSHPALARRNHDIELLEAYSKFLEEQGYLDTDWRTEAPYAIDEFLKTQKP